jgi:hypothetical protein
MTVALEFSSNKETTRKPILQIFHGKFRLPLPKIEVSKYNPTICPPIASSKVVVFDLDETLGSFGDLFLLWSGIRHFYPEFNQLDALLDIYPEFLRNGILSILSFIHQKKKQENVKNYLFIQIINVLPLGFLC